MRFLVWPPTRLIGSVDEDLPVTSFPKHSALQIHTEVYYRQAENTVEYLENYEYR